MTYRDGYHQIVKLLEQGGCESAAFEASCLLGHYSGVSRGELPLRGGETMDAAVWKDIEKAAGQRAQGRPLQYILGEWDFLTLTLEVGEGVLIPRPDTELLCETAAKKLAGKQEARVLDLCAGSGCVGLGIASLCPQAVVTAVEVSGQALSYLKRNSARYPAYSLTPVKADVLLDAEKIDGIYDAIVSNPPYIPSEELPTLMREVQFEPRMALDGGDGLRFYRAIADKWVKKLASGGFCAVEVGIGQAHEVAALFEKAGLTNPEIFRDYSGIERVVTAHRSV